MPDFLSFTVLYYRTVRIEAQVPINPVMPVHIAYGHLFHTFNLIFNHSLGIPHVLKILTNLILLNLTALPKNASTIREFYHFLDNKKGAHFTDVHLYNNIIRLLFPQPFLQLLPASSSPGHFP